MSKAVQKWLKIARTEFNSAKALSSLGLEHAYVVLFLCQQTCEKCIKAYLVSQKTKIKKIHDLNELTKDILDDQLKEALRETHNLTQYVAKFRYPQEEIEEKPTNEEVSEALAIAHKTYDLITKKLNAE